MFNKYTLSTEYLVWCVCVCVSSQKVTVYLKFLPLWSYRERNTKDRDLHKKIWILGGLICIYYFLYRLSTRIPFRWCLTHHVTRNASISQLNGHSVYEDCTYTDCAAKPWGNPLPPAPEILWWGTIFSGFTFTVHLSIPSTSICYIRYREAYNRKS